VVVPLGFRLAPLTGPQAIAVLRVARYAQPIGALGAIAAFFLPRGVQAASLAAAWLLVCGIAAVAGLVELIEVRSLHPVHLLPAAALGLLSVGSAWLVASRGGIGLGFTEPIPELTAVHFHYAGFSATMMSALAVRALSSASMRTRWIGGGAGLLIVLGTPLTAAGIATGAAALTVIGPVLLAIGVLTTSALTAFIVAPALRGRARWLLTISASGVVIPMLLGVDYAAGRVLPIPTLDLRTMALVHGDLNALVFALLGFVGWMLA
jgi:YndJ-like protein